MYQLAKSPLSVRTIWRLTSVQRTSVVGEVYLIWILSKKRVWKGWKVHCPCMIEQRLGAPVAKPSEEPILLSGPFFDAWTVVVEVLIAAIVLKGVVGPAFTDVFFVITVPFHKGCVTVKLDRRNRVISCDEGISLEIIIWLGALVSAKQAG